MSEPLQKIALLAAGGTGGHLFPAQALSSELHERGWAVHLVTDGRAGKFADFLQNDHIHIVPSGTFAKNPVKLIRSMFKNIRGFFAARRLIKRLKPDLVVGFGGYPSFLPVLTARRIGVPCLIHEQNAVMGRANKLLARYVDAICAGFPLSDMYGHEAKILVTGNPVRPTMLEAAQTIYRAPRKNGKFNLLIFGGSQGAHYFSSVMPKVILQMPVDLRKRLVITQQARPEDKDELSEFYRKHEIPAEIATFFPNMNEHLIKAHFVICRAGASTVSELAVTGRPSLLVPYPFALDHDQAKNAEAMVAAGGSQMVLQSELSEDRLREIVIDHMQTPKQLEKMAKATQKTGKAEAAATLADICVSIAAGLKVKDLRS